MIVAALLLLAGLPSTANALNVVVSYPESSSCLRERCVTVDTRKVSCGPSTCNVVLRIGPVPRAASVSIIWGKGRRSLRLAAGGRATAKLVIPSRTKVLAVRTVLLERTVLRPKAVHVGRRLLRAKIVLAAGRNTCAVTVVGNVVYCWGDNSFGQLGDGTRIDSSLPRRVRGLREPVRAFAVGTAHACAVEASGLVACWGANRWGQLGNGSRRDSALPVRATEVTNARDVVLGAEFSCALRRTGDPWCWGDNRAAQILSVGERGYGRWIDIAQRIQSWSVLSGLTAGKNHLCALSASAVTCRGANDVGQLGTENPGTQPTVPGISDAVRVSAGGDETCVVRAMGGVSCWGLVFPLLPGGWGTQVRDIPISGVSELAVGDRHTCALQRSGLVLCWGRNDHGGLGNGTLVDRWDPVPVAGGHAWRFISVGSVHTCGVDTQRVVRCWGKDDAGQLGS